MDTKQLNTKLKWIVWKTKPLDIQENTNLVFQSIEQQGQSSQEHYESSTQ